MKKGEGIEVPLGVKLVSIWYYISIGLFLFSIITFLINPAGFISRLSSLLINSNNPPILLFSIIYLVYSIASATLFFFVARGLWKLQEWARIVAIILSLFYIVNYSPSFSSIENIIMSVIGLVVNIAVPIYLIFSKKVKELFKKR